MRFTAHRTRWPIFALAALAIAGVNRAADSSHRNAIWSHDNLIAWCVAPWDAKKRNAEERAKMLAELGFKHYAYIGQNEDFAALDAEINALKKHGVNLLAWYFPFDADNPLARKTLELFRRRQVHPQLWVALAPKESAWPKNQEEWEKLLPEGVSMPKNPQEADQLSPAEQAKLHEAVTHVVLKLYRQDMPKTSEEHKQRLAQETGRIHALVNLAKPYGVKVALYNHNGWFGLMDNQVAIIENLKERGVADIGIVYNFSHARDDLHDDTINFPAIWMKIKPYVVAVNITGTAWERTYIYPSQGDRELEMMRTIQESGWKGAIGLIAEKGGDAQVTLSNYMIGLDWLSAELRKPGSGGPRPFPTLPQVE